MADLITYKGKTTVNLDKIHFITKEQGRLSSQIKFWFDDPRSDRQWSFDTMEERDRVYDELMLYRAWDLSPEDSELSSGE